VSGSRLGGTFQCTRRPQGTRAWRGATGVFAPISSTSTITAGCRALGKSSSANRPSALVRIAPNAPYLLRPGRLSSREAADSLILASLASVQRSRGASRRAQRRGALRGTPSGASSSGRAVASHADLAERLTEERSTPNRRSPRSSPFPFRGPPIISLPPCAALGGKHPRTPDALRIDPPQAAANFGLRCEQQRTCPGGMLGVGSISGAPRPC
jgi:hypothetical protein